MRLSRRLSGAPRRGFARPLLLLAALAGAGCGSTDGRMLLQPGAGSSGGGSGGATGGSSAGGGSSGTGGSGGATELRDAGADAKSDASLPEHSCVVGSLAAYCARATSHCPSSYAEARARLTTDFLGRPSLLIVQRACSAPDGSARVRVTGDFSNLRLTYVFDAATEQLVSFHVWDDTGGCPGGPVLDSESFGAVPGFYGEALPDCTGELNTAECGLPPDWHLLDAGPLRAALVDAGVDAGSLDDGGPYECILAP